MMISMKKSSSVADILKIILFFMLCLGSAHASDSNFFDIQYPNQDLSITYLNFLFGPLGTIGLYLNPNSLYLLVVKILIFPILLASLLGGWVTFTGTLKTAQEGKFLGEKLSSTSAVFRGFVGMMLLTPDYTGYAYIQKLLMMILIFGVGLANTLWGRVLDFYASGQSLSSKVTYTPGDQAVAQNLISHAVLVEYLSKAGLILQASAISDAYSNKYVQISIDEQPGYTDPGPLNIFQTTSQDGLNSEIIDGVDSLMQGFRSQSFVNLLVQWLIEHPSEAMSSDIINNLYSDAGISNQDLNAWMMNNYMNTHTMLAIIDPQSESVIDGYRQKGWITAGALYWTLAQSSGSSKSYADNLNPATEISIPTGSTTNLQDWLKKISANMFENNPALSTSIANIQITVSGYGLDPENGIAPPQNAIESTITSIPLSFNSLKDTFDKAIRGEDPIINFVQDCQRTLKGILIFMVTTVVLIGAFSFIAAMRWQLPFVHQTFYFVSTLLLMIVSFAFIFLPPSAMGGYFLPLIPLLIFSGGVLAWYLKVIEAMIAIPFVAVALVEPTQDDFGRAEASLLLTLHVFLKPSLMLIGFILGGRLSTIAISLFTLPFNAYITYKNFTIFSSVFYFDRLLLFIMLNNVVVYMIIALVNRSFSLIYKIPDQVFNWIGHRGGHESDVASMVSEAKTGAEQGIEMMTQIFNIGKAVGNVALDSMKAIKEGQKT